MHKKFLIHLLLLCLLSGCASEEWVKDYVASQTAEINTKVQTAVKDAAESKATATSLQEEVNKTLRECKGGLEALKHDLNHLDTSLHELSLKTQKAMENLEKDVHRDVTNQETRVAALMDKVQKLDTEVTKFREALLSLDNKVRELGDILYPLTGKEIKPK